MSRPRKDGLKANEPHNGGLPVEYFGPFGWTTSAKVAEWFDERFDEYCERKNLKVRTHLVFEEYNRSLGYERNLTAEDKPIK